jgi:hypothetical protein
MYLSKDISVDGSSVDCKKKLTSIVAIVDPKGSRKVVKENDFVCMTGRKWLIANGKQLS